MVERELESGATLVARRKRRSPNLGLTHRCPSGKVPYRTEEHALLIATVHFGKYGDLLFPYLCPECYQWHNTRQPQDAAQAEEVRKHRAQRKRT